MIKPEAERYCFATRKTPEIILTEEGFIIEGRSIPENPGLFYRPVYEWMMEKFPLLGDRPLLEFGFDYLNTASVKWIYLILRDFIMSGKDFRLIWYYEKGDEDMLELGKMYKALLGRPITIVEVDEIPGFRS